MKIEEQLQNILFKYYVYAPKPMQKEIKALLSKEIKETIGVDDPLDSKLEGYNKFVGIRNSLRTEQRQRAKERGLLK